MQEQWTAITISGGDREAWELQCSPPLSVPEAGRLALLLEARAGGEMAERLRKFEAELGRPCVFVLTGSFRRPVCTKTVQKAA